MVEEEEEEVAAPAAVSAHCWPGRACGRRCECALPMHGARRGRWRWRRSPPAAVCAPPPLCSRSPRSWPSCRRRRTRPRRPPPSPSTSCGWTRTLQWRWTRCSARCAQRPCWGGACRLRAAACAARGPRARLARPLPTPATRLACPLDSLGAQGQRSPVTEYFFWPRKDAWEELKAALDARGWIGEREKVLLLNQTTEVRPAPARLPSGGGSGSRRRLPGREGALVAAASAQGSAAPRRRLQPHGAGPASPAPAAAAASGCRSRRPSLRSLVARARSSTTGRTRTSTAWRRRVASSPPASSAVRQPPVRRFGWGREGVRRAGGDGVGLKASRRRRRRRCGLQPPRAARAASHPPFACLQCTRWQLPGGPLTPTAAAPPAMPRAGS